MTQRISFGAIAIAIVFALFAADAHVSSFPIVAGTLFARGSFLPIAMAIIGVLAVKELASMCRATGASPGELWATISCVALILAPWLGAAGLLGEGPTDLEAMHLQMFLVAAAFLGSGLGVLRRSDVEWGLTDIAGTWLLFIYCGVLPSFLVILRCDSALLGPRGDGAWVVLCIIVVCKVSDIGAYFIGSWFGRTKLIPRVSPNKSVEGALGGIFVSAMISLLLFKIHHSTISFDSFAFQMQIHEITGVYLRMTWFQALIFGVVMSIAGQFGDLVESVFKRSAKVKDSAHLVPGFGGILDMVDSPIAAAPIAWFLLTRWWAVL
ncbi:MAG: phosphatidate cytidylyltransferase [Planctomycetes bacterium]|nr:phosphatidate cytidylyltransferase [Planctomycetota bacterium]